MSNIPIDDVRFDLEGAQATLSIDTLDSLNFSRRGTLAKAELTDYFPVYGLERAVTHLRLSAVHAIPLGERLSAVLTAGWEDVVGGASPFFMLFSLADFSRFAALSREVTVGERAAYASVAAHYRIASLPTRLGRGVYLGGSFELARVWQKRSESDVTNLRPAGTLFAGADTVLGPIYAGVGLGYGGGGSFYVFLGRPF